MNDLNESTEHLLREGLVDVPADFRDTVMQNIACAARDEQRSKFEGVDPAPAVATQMQWWQWLGLIAGSAVGTLQVVRYIFTLWVVSTAG